MLALAYTDKTAVCCLQVNLMVTGSEKRHRAAPFLSCMGYLFLQRLLAALPMHFCHWLAHSGIVSSPSVDMS